MEWLLLMIIFIWCMMVMAMPRVSLVLLLISHTESLQDHPTLQKMHRLSNQLRQEHHLATCTLSPQLTQAAQDHAWYMARCHDRDEEDFEHRGGNSSPGRRAARYAYEGVVTENLARGYNSIPEVFQAWQNSPAHRAALFSASHDAGFGYAVAKDGTTYWVGLYGNPKINWDLGGPSPSH
jgi:uncharacterized protein YkwD